MKNMPNLENEKNYEVECLIDKRTRTYEKTTVTQYLVRWLDYEPEYDEWKSLSALAGCTDLIEKYELAHSFAKTTRNKILETADARRLDDQVDLKQLVTKILRKKILNADDAIRLDGSVDLKQLVSQQKQSAVDKSARLKKTSAPPSLKRPRDRPLKRLQPKKERRSHEQRQSKIILSPPDSHYYQKKVYIGSVIEFQKK